MGKGKRETKSTETVNWKFYNIFKHILLQLSKINLFCSKLWNLQRFLSKLISKEKEPLRYNVRIAKLTTGQIFN